MKILIAGPGNLAPYHAARLNALVNIIPYLTYIRINAKENYRPWSKDLGPIMCKVMNIENGSNISTLLESEKPDVLMTVGYKSMTLLRAALWAKRRSIPCVVQSDSNHEDNPRSPWKELTKRIIVKKCFDAAFVAGERSYEYIKSLGIKEDKIWRGVDVIENLHFSTAKNKWNSDKFNNYFITVSRLSPEKNIEMLIQAFKSYRNEGGKWGLLIVGTGPQERELISAVPETISNYVHWYGWASYKEIPSLYNSASCLILPSVSEPWGLVINEAMAAGLPVLVSRKCGCCPDLCKNGVNGFDFDPHSAEELANLMRKVSSGQVDLKAMGAASRNIISYLTPETWAKTVTEIAEKLVKKNNEDYISGRI